MRCKNCGTENDDNRYICENCGSPLYDEEDISAVENDATMTFGAINESESVKSQGRESTEPPSNNDKNSKNTIVIAILAVVLVAVIISVVIVARGKSGNNETSSSLTKSSVTSSQTVSQYSTTEVSTTESTTESTTKETTTKPTTTTTAAPKTYSIKLISQGGGIVDGAGTYKDGDNVTITATPDENYEFDGWYSGGQKISSSTTYSFTANKNISISAVFNEIVTEEVEDFDGGLD